MRLSIRHSRQLIMEVERNKIVALGSSMISKVAGALRSVSAALQ